MKTSKLPRKQTPPAPNQNQFCPSHKMVKSKFTPKPPTEKLPLAVRKDIRDNFESKVEDYNKEISDLLGKDFAVNFNANEVFPYKPEGSTAQPGKILAGYAEGFISALKDYLQKFGDEGKAFFNDAVTKSEVTLHVNEKGDDAPTITSEVKDGVYQILFNHTSLGYNVTRIGESMLAAIEAAPHEGFSIQAKNSIENDYNDEIEEVTADIAKLTGISDIILDPNFEGNYKALLAKSDISWQKNIGKVALAYMNGLKRQLELQKFGSDDMLQEGLAEVLTSKTFKIRIVPKTTKGQTNEIVIEDGVAYMQTTLDMWWYNASDMGKDLVNLL